MTDSVKVEDIELYAWLGEDELGSGEIGLKQAICPAGTIPMVSIEPSKLEKYWPQAEAAASHYGNVSHWCGLKLWKW